MIEKNEWKWVGEKIEMKEPKNCWWKKEKKQWKNVQVCLKKQ